MVKFQASKYYTLRKRNNAQISHNYDFEDLVQAGSEGLLVAIDKYDARNEKGASFNTYAFWWVRAHINRFLNFKVSPIHIPYAKRNTHFLKMVELDKEENAWK